MHFYCQLTDCLCTTRLTFNLQDYNILIMKISRTWLGSFLRVVLIIPLCAGVWLGGSWLYTTLQLRRSAARGVFPTAEEGMLGMIDQWYANPEKVRIVAGGPDSISSSHIWYITACVWGGTRSDGSLVGNDRVAYDMPGSFFLNTRDGWVYVPEEVFPVEIGAWMKTFGLAGPGSSDSIGSPYSSCGP